MRKEDIKKILIEWEEKEFPKLIEREISLNPYPSDIITLTGVRRSGKTFLLYLLAQKLLEKFDMKEILYINFEHELFPQRIEAREIRKFFEVHSELYDKKIRFILFDEVQRMSNWETLLRRLYDEKKYHMFVTGSSYELRPNELPGSLRGRTINYNVFPLNFREFLKFKSYKIEKRKLVLEVHRGKILKLLREYLLFGGFPDVVLRNEIFEKKKLISSYFDTILLRDIIEKHEIRNSRILEMFIKYLISISSFYFSATKVEKFFRSLGERCSKATLLDFFEYAEKASLVFKTEIFSPKIKERKQYPVKVYCIDNAFINFVNPRFSENLGALMENLVGVELFRMNENKEIFHFKDYQGREVDFLVKEGLRVKQLIQVSYASARDEIEKREIEGLLKASEVFKKDKPELLVITWDFEDEEDIKGKKIKFIPLWKWLL